VFATHYSAWITRMTQVPHEQSFWSEVRRLVKLILFDAAILVAVVIATSLSIDTVSRWLASLTAQERWLTDALVVVAALAASVPFIIGVARCTRSLGHLIAKESRDPTTQAPRALVVAIQIGIVLVVGLPVLALTSAFLPASVGPLLLTAIVAVLLFSFWRSATDLQQEVKAGVHVVMDMLARQGKSEGDDTGDLEQAVHSAMPWFGSIQSLTIARESEAVGRTLAEINLRGRTGANVVAIRRGKDVLVPNAEDALLAGDILAVTGSPNAIRAAELVVSAPGGASDTQTEMAILRR
jgi:CPA2 family monovalent cation:H+ antiporter-2